MKWGKVDFRDFERAQKQLEKLAEVDFDRITQDLTKEIASRVLAKAIKRTPVGVAPDVSEAIFEEHWSDYEGGTLRRGWQVGQVTKKGNLYEIEVYNPVEYAPYVEYGHRQQPGRYVPALGKRLKSSWVEGKFMLTISIQEVEAQSRALIESRVMEELKKVFS